MIEKYFRKTAPERMQLIQARIPKPMIQTLKPFMKKQGLSWQELVRGALQALVEELEMTKVKKEGTKTLASKKSKR